MTGEAAWSLQQAFYTRLSNFAALTAQLATTGSIYDDIPQGVAFPYVVIGESDIIDFSNKSSIGQEHDVMIHTWSRYQGFKEAKDIMQAIYDALHQQEASITVTGQNLILVQNIFVTHVRENDGLTRHGIQRFRVLTEES